MRFLHKCMSGEGHFSEGRKGCHRSAEMCVCGTCLDECAGDAREEPAFYNTEAIIKEGISDAICPLLVCAPWARSNG